MCGITGFYSPNHANRKNSLSIISKMAGILEHRGPDKEGIYTDYENNLFLGHTRLSILDLSESGNQPFTSISGNYTIVFNGEIYNHLTIRSEINKISKIEWKGTSDTETLIESIDAFGIESSLDRIVGMFSFAVWDNVNKQLVLARDRVGEKPLYYSIFNNTLIFSSEIKSIKAHPDFKNEHNYKALSTYFNLGYIPAPMTAWKNVKKLRPGCLVYFSEKQLDINNKNISYWKITNCKSKKYNNYSQKEYKEKLDYLIDNSVNAQMLSDVPIGAFLSGGVDSSTIVSFMQKNSINPINTFSIGFENQKFNEAIFAKSIANHLGTNHTELYISEKEALNVVPLLTNMFDEPFGDSSAIPTFLVSKLASQSVKVSLSGDGGDELFGGYRRYFNSKFNSLSNISTIFNKIGLNTTIDTILSKKQKSNDQFSKSNFAIDLVRSKNFNSFYFKSMSHWKNSPTKNIFNSINSFDLFQNSFKSYDYLHKRMGIDFLSYLPDDILTKVDRAAMSVSLESRVPLLDHRLIEFAWNVPTNLKYKNGSTKWLLKEVLYDYVPKKMIDRPKMGFSIPMAEWLRGPLKDWAESLINEEKLKTQNFIDIEKIKLCWELFLKGDNRLQHPIWLVLMYISWFKVN